MKHLLAKTSFAPLIAVAILVTSTLMAQSAKTAKHPNTKKWESLFKDNLSNAIGADTWKMEDGVLVAVDHFTLWTTESYGDFVLDLEFKVAKESNSGVFLRSGDIKSVLAALEVQVHESGDGTKYGMVGAIYDAAPPLEDASKPIGEWNHFTITCKGSRVRLVFNEKLVLNANLDKWPEKGVNADGTENKFPIALKDFSRVGPIGFQGLHGKAQAPVWYRNIKIKPLE
jgi:hypothetical protein